MPSKAVRDRIHAIKDEDVKDFKMIICKVSKSKHRDGGYSLREEDVGMVETGKWLNKYYDTYTPRSIVRYNNKFYAVLQRGIEFSVLNDVDGHFVRLLPISISKFAGELLIGDVWHD